MNKTDEVATPHSELPEFTKEDLELLKRFAREWLSGKTSNTRCFTTKAGPRTALISSNS